MAGGSGAGQGNQQNTQQGNWAVGKGRRKAGGDKGRGQEEMKFMKTIMRSWLLIHSFVYSFTDIYMPTVCWNKGQWDPSPGLRSLIKRQTSKQETVPH